MISLIDTKALSKPKDGDHGLCSVGVQSGNVIDLIHDYANYP
jgi:hypothetical protein